MKWEYKQLEEYGPDEYTLDRLGDEGWELVTVIRKHVDGGAFVFYFKRPIKEGKKLIT